MMKISKGDLLREVEEIANLGIFDLDLTTGTWTGSDNFIKIFGLHPKSVYTEEEFQAIVHPDDFQEVMAYFTECLQSKDHFNYEYRVVHSDGKTMHVSSKSRIFRDKNNKPIRVLGIKQDITQRKTDEIKLAQLNEMNEQKNEVLTMVAHDLKSPINQIQALTSLLSNEASDSQKLLLDIINSSLDNARDIINDLIEIAQLERDIKLRLTSIDINKLVLKSVLLFKHNALQKKIELKTSLCKEAEALIHRAKFQRVIDNLLSNAIKFSPEGETVTITTEKQNEVVTLSVQDNGIGIDEENIPTLFKKFSKMRRSGTKGEKSIGLGLSIVNEIINKHKGKIEVKSKINEGTTFTVKIKAGQ